MTIIRIKYSESIYRIPITNVSLIDNSQNVYETMKFAMIVYGIKEIIPLSQPQYEMILAKQLQDGIDEINIEIDEVQYL